MMWIYWVFTFFERSSSYGSMSCEGAERAIDSNIFVQEPTKVDQNAVKNGEHPLVILSVAKDLARWTTRSFASAQDDTESQFVSYRLMN